MTLQHFSVCPFQLRSADPNILCGLNFVMGYIILAPDGIYEGKEWWKYLLSPLADLLLLLSLKTWLLPLLGVKLILPYKDLILKERYVMLCYNTIG